MATANKLTYLNETKGLLKDIINYASAGIDNNTTFRNYAVKLYDAYLEILKNKYVLLDNIPKQVATGTIINLNNALGILVYNLNLKKESIQNGTPTTSNPIEIKTVKGYKNLFDKDNANILNVYINTSSSSENYKRLMPNSSASSFYISCEPNTFYTITKTAGQRFAVGSCTDIPVNYTVCNNFVYDQTGSSLTIQTGATDNYLVVFYYLSTADTISEEQMRSSVMVVQDRIESPTLYNTQVTSSGTIQTMTNRVANVPVNGTSNLYVTAGTYTLKIPNLNSCSVLTKDANGNILDNYATAWHNLPYTFTLTKNGYLYFTGRKSDNSSITASNFTPQLITGLEKLPYVPYGTNYVAVNVNNGSTINLYPISLNNNELVGKGTNFDELIVDKTGEVHISKIFDKINSYSGQSITSDYWSTTGGLDTGATIYYVMDEENVIDTGKIVNVSLFEGTNNISNSENAITTISYVRND